MKSSKAYTLLELLLVLTVVAILTVAGVYGWRAWAKGQEQQRVVSRLLQGLNFARQAAMTYRQPVTLCAAASAMACGDQWSQGVLIFLDPHHLSQPEPSTLLMQLPPLAKQSLMWRGWLGHAVVRFEPDGMPHGYHGSFYFGPPGKEQPLLIINVVGRVRGI